MEIYLLRHGRSQANEANLVTGGKADILCLEGRRQAVAAAKLLHHCGLDNKDTLCFVSDWVRARETAALAAPSLFFHTEPRLGETDAGSVADMPQEEFTGAYPTFWSSFNPDRAYPGGESHAELHARVLAWLTEVVSMHPTDARVLAVTHAGPISCLLHAVCKVDMAHFPMFIAANASLTKLKSIGADSWSLTFFSLSPEMMW